MPSGLRNLKTLVFENWHIKLLSLAIAFLLWFYVEINDKTSFQVQIPVENIPKGVEVFPKEVLVVGKISEKFFKDNYLSCFKVKLVWDGKSKFATVKVIPPVPRIFVEVNSIYPKTLEVRKR